jgi:hypothetical protein
VAVYQDDITWWSSTVEEHWEMTQQLFARCRAVNLRLGAKKTKLFCPYARYLGCIVGQGECHLDPRRVDAVSALEVSPDPAAIRQFVGLCVWSRRWIPGYSILAAPLTDMLRKDVSLPAAWGPDQDRAVQRLKAALTAFPCLRQADCGQPFTLLCDASKVGVASVLRWIDDFLLKSEFSLSFMRTRKTDLSAKQEQDGHLFLPYNSGVCGC